MAHHATDKKDSQRSRHVLRLNLVALAILAVGCLQMAGFVLENRILRGLGAASGASPLPKVFSAVNDYETFAADFTILYELAGKSNEIAVTPAFYQRLKGPYNRRNVYGAALAYAPVLPEKIWKTVFSYGLQNGGAFFSELGLPEKAARVRVRVRAKTEGSDAQWIFDPGLAQ